VSCAVALCGVAGAEPALTIYNQNFAVVRETVPLELERGVNPAVAFTDITAHVEPDSVMLRDPAGKRDLRILEQNYRADPVSQGLLLSLYEGKTIDFLVLRGDSQKKMAGTIVRSGYTPHVSAMSRYGQAYAHTQSARAYGPSGQPIIEMDGELRFGLPGTPLFPALTDDTILKPTLNWVIEANKGGPLDAELCYVTGGMTWEASYNLVAPEKDNVLDVVGWVTMDNQSGKTFENAKIKLMAGDVSKIEEGRREAMAFRGQPMGFGGGGMGPPVSEKAFDEYHLYTLARRSTLRDRETKQVEFLRAEGVKADRFYVYDGAKIDWRRYRGWTLESIRNDRGYGTECNPKVWAMCEFENKKSNGLGIPLPKGRTRFYRRDDDGQLEFTGENVIDHTPTDETVRVYIGSAFDLVGERRRMDYQIDHSRCTLDETFEVRLRNHKKAPIVIRVVEHLYRGKTWEIRQPSEPFVKLDSQRIEFRLQVQPDEEATLTYAVHYTW
jgi:hypothetical protein